MRLIVEPQDGGIQGWRAVAVVVAAFLVLWGLYVIF